MKAMTEEHLAILRRHMVEVISMHADLMEDEIGKAVLDQRVLAAMLRVRRHLFVPPQLAAVAYHDTPLPIGFDKTVSQPFICALMADLLDVRPHEAVLEIGTGLGYQAAILAELARHVWTIEVVEEFGSHADDALRQLGYDNVDVKIGEGTRGWLEHAPFDKILVTAAADQPPQMLLDQLTPGGRMVLPLGPDGNQQLTVVDKKRDGSVEKRAVIPVRFGRLETVV